jgi:glycerol-3-phosphate O-acyltransferase/dihydroxyacetone phosphate acyltransferase
MERSDNLVKVTGSDTTMFLKELKVGDKIRPPGTSIAMKVISIESDSVLQLDGSEADSVKLPREPTSYDILPKIDQRDVYGKVIDRLAGGGAVGIFPEGGSHDQTDLLPLKVGVALIAYEAILQDGLNVPIVPVGLNYFQRHKFRGRAVVEYGRPIIIDPSTVKGYKQGGEEKRRVCNELLERIQDGMKSVLVTAPDYETLQLIHTARRLWQRKELKTSEKQDLSRRFAEGYQQLILHVNGEPPKEWLELNDRVVKYQKELTELGIRDYQVPGLDREKGEITSVEDLDGDTVLREMRLPYQIAHVLILLLLAGIPAIFLNLPVGLIARIYAEGRRKKAVARSKVKIRGHDVLMTEKILVSIVLVPTFWVLYALLLYRYTELDGPAITLGFFCMPLFSYMSIMWAEAGMVDLKDLRPYLMRLLPANRRRIIALPETRKNLQRDIRAFVKIHGPLLGDLYYNEDVDWSEYQEKKRKSYPLLSDALTPTRKKEEGKTE